MDRGWRRRAPYGDKALDEATTKGWTVDMKNDWKVIFPVQKE
jgi:hypothetical protein